jgi:hypothetical protein
MEEIMLIVDIILDLIKHYGVWGILLFFIALGIHDPDRIVKLKSIIWKSIYLISNKGKKKYIGSSIEYRLNRFFNDENLNRAFGNNNIRFHINWVKRDNDPILTENGTVILNLESTMDQTRNVLKATQISLPLVFCSSLRNSIKKDYQDAIDFAVMKKIADQLGKNAYPIFEKYFLGPGFDGKPDLLELYKELVRIDSYGIFVSIFIVEINNLSSRFYAEALYTDISDDIKSLIEYLLTIANRGKGEEIELNFLNKYFKLGFILVAKKMKAESEGTSPYINRLTEKLKFICDKVYLIGFSCNTTFFHELDSLLKNDSRYSISNVEKIKSTSVEGVSEYIEVMSIEKNKEQSNDVFKDTVIEKKIEQNAYITCQLLESTHDLALFNVFGLIGYLEKKHCSWKRSQNCAEIFTNGNEYTVKILYIDYNNERIMLTNRRDNENPLLVANSPKLKDKIAVEINMLTNNYLLGITNDDFEVIIPKEELSWSQFEDPSKYINKKIDIIVYDILKEDGLILGSIKRNTNNPWININTIYPRDSLISAEVEHVNDFGVYFVLPNGLLGFLRKDKILQSHSVVDYIKGNRFNVVIDKVIGDKKKIYLRLPN